MARQCCLQSLLLYSIISAEDPWKCICSEYDFARSLKGGWVHFWWCAYFQENMVPSFCSLTFCSLSNNKISSVGAHELAGALQVNQSLQKLKWVQAFVFYFSNGRKHPSCLCFHSPEQLSILVMWDFSEQLSWTCTHTWQSRVEIEGYSVAYFDHFAAFKAP